jgi:hypothetical protein
MKCFVSYQVYLVRFKVECTDDGIEECSSPEDESEQEESNQSPVNPGKAAAAAEDTQYPASVSIDVLLKAGQLIKPKRKNQVSLSLEKFDINKQEWVSVEKSLDMLVETESFSSGGFRDAFLGVSKDKAKWVIKKYNDKAMDTITESLHSNIEDHTRKQIQLHCAARHLAKVFSTKTPKAFGECFKFNRAYYTEYEGKAATVEEFVEGTFRKYINNNGKVCKQPENCSAAINTIFEKAECLVHYSYVQSSGKLMLLDLQGADYHLYDPEIATAELHDENAEAYFCCGNLSYVSINEFNDKHKCNTFCDMIDIIHDANASV